MTYAERLAEADAYRAKMREREERRLQIAMQELHTLFAHRHKDGIEGPLLIMAAVGRQ